MTEDLWLFPASLPPPRVGHFTLPQRVIMQAPCRSVKPYGRCHGSNCPARRIPVQFAEHPQTAPPGRHPHRTSKRSRLRPRAAAAGTATDTDTETGTVPAGAKHTDREGDPEARAPSGRDKDTVRATYTGPASGSRTVRPGVPETRDPRKKRGPGGSIGGVCWGREARRVRLCRRAEGGAGGYGGGGGGGPAKAPEQNEKKKARRTGGLVEEEGAARDGRWPLVMRRAAPGRS